MTETELSNYRFLVKEAERLRNAACETVDHEYIAYKSPIINDLPHGNVVGDTTCNTALNVRKARASFSERWQFESLLSDTLRRVRDIEYFICQIKDDKTRLIFQYRFFDGMSNTKVGKKLNYSERSIRRIIDQYIKDDENADFAVL